MTFPLAVGEPRWQSEPARGVRRSVWHEWVVGLPMFLMAMLIALGCSAQTAEGVSPGASRHKAEVVAPQRIVTLLPSLTESVCALGACARLVGVDRHSNWPASVNQLPKVGGLNEPQLERIVRLRPDLVLLDASSRLEDRLRQLGIPTLVVDTASFQDMTRGLQRIAEALGEPQRARRLIATLEDQIERVAQTTRARLGARRPRVYFEVDPSIYAASEASFIGYLLERLGARNIIPGDLGAFPKINPEFVVQQNPDLLIVSASQRDLLRARPGWGRMPALQQGQVCMLDRESADLVVRPSPRVVEGLSVLAACLSRIP